MPIEPLAAIIGNPESVFPKQLAVEFRKRGYQVVIISRSFDDETLLPCGTRIISSYEFESPSFRVFLRSFGWLLKKAEWVVITLGKKRYTASLAEKIEEDYRPSFARVIVNALSISSAIRKITPDFVFGQEAFSYGLATALSRGRWPRAIMPWGGDIYYFSQTSWVSFLIVRFALRSVDLVCPASISAAKYVVDRFSVAQGKSQAISWGVDKLNFSRANDFERNRILEHFGIGSEGKIILNVRRFNPSWGSHIAIEAFLKLAKGRDDCHFVCLGGEGTEAEIAKAKDVVRNMGLLHRFTFLDGVISLKECAEIMSVSDIFVSLMKTKDMRSASILQAVSCGAVPVLSEQPEFREIEKMGFCAQFVNFENADATVEAIGRYLNDQEYMERVRNCNYEYTDRFEDKENQMNILLQTITSYR